MLILSTYKLVPFPYDKPVTMLANLYKHFVYLLLYFFAFFIAIIAVLCHTCLVIFGRFLVKLTTTKPNP